ADQAHLIRRCRDLLDVGRVQGEGLVGQDVATCAKSLDDASTTLSGRRAHRHDLGARLTDRVPEVGERALHESEPGMPLECRDVHVALMVLCPEPAGAPCQHRQHTVEPHAASFRTSATRTGSPVAMERSAATPMATASSPSAPVTAGAPPSTASAQAAICAANPSPPPGGSSAVPDSSVTVPASASQGRVRSPPVPTTMTSRRANDAGRCPRLISHTAVAPPANPTVISR